jgi:hypothetical protein
MTEERAHAIFLGVAIMFCLVLAAFVCVAGEAALNFLMLHDLVPMFGILLLAGLPPSMAFLAVAIVG